MDEATAKKYLNKAGWDINNALDYVYGDNWQAPAVKLNTLEKELEQYISGN